MPDDRGVFPRLTVAENIALARHSAFAPTPIDVFALFPDLAGRRQQQQVAIPRALATGPRLLIVDELSQGLQPSIVQSLTTALLEATRTHGLALILVDQNPQLAMKICRKVMVMQRGEVVAAGIVPGGGSGSTEIMAHDHARGVRREYRSSFPPTPFQLSLAPVSEVIREVRVAPGNVGKRMPGMASGQRQQQLGELIEVIYDNAVNADWSDTMALLKQRFHSTAESLYMLDLKDHRIREVHKDGITPAFLKTLDAHFFTPDNPWRKVPFMHVPEYVRTDRRLATHFRDHQVLCRSRYYNEWLRPQRLDHSLGTTILVQRGSIANITLHRPAEIGHYRAADIADFKHLGGHLCRALRVAQRLELNAAYTETGAAALDRLPYGVAFLAADGWLAYANRATETLLRHGDALKLRSGRLVASDIRCQAGLDRLLRSAMNMEDTAPGPDGIAIPRPDGKPALRLTATPAPSGHRPLAGDAPAILLLISDPAVQPYSGADAARHLYRLTPSEMRLAEALTTGSSLRQAADQSGITYQTARSYLKVLFQKTGARRQTDLVARLLAVSNHEPAP